MRTPIRLRAGRLLATGSPKLPPTLDAAGDYFSIGNIRRNTCISPGLGTDAVQVGICHLPHAVSVRGCSRSLTGRITVEIR